MTIEPTNGRGEVGYRLASAISYLLNPLILPPIAFVLIQWHFGAGGREVIQTFIVSLTFFCLIPFANVIGMVWRGEAKTLEVREQKARTKPLLVGIVSYILGLMALAFMTQTATALVVLVAALFPLNAALILLINRRWKISAHVSSLAGFVSGLLFIAVAAWQSPLSTTESVLTAGTMVPLLILVPLLMWARVRAGAHTVGQVVAGAAFGLFLPPLELWVLAVYVMGWA